MFPANFVGAKNRRRNGFFSGYYFGLNMLLCFTLEKYVVIKGRLHTRKPHSSRRLFRNRARAGSRSRAGDPSPRAVVQPPLEDDFSVALSPGSVSLAVGAVVSGCVSGWVSGGISV